MIIENVRIDWAFIFEPSRNNDKYSVCVLIRKDDPQLAKVQKAIADTVKKGIAAGKFTEANVKSRTFKRCLWDGDEAVEAEERGEHYKGCMFFNAYNKNQPGIVDENVQPLMESDRLYSGCYCHVDVNFYPYNHPKGGKGIGAGLNNIMLYKEGERLDGRKSATEAFEAFAKEDSVSDFE